MKENASALFATTQYNVLMDNSKKQLFEVLNKLYSTSDSCKEKFQKFSDYYRGDFGKNPNYNNLENSNNIIKQIVDTKVTLSLDMKMDAVVSAKMMAFEELQHMEETQDIADVLDSCLNDVYVSNKLESKKELIVRNGLLYGISPVEVVWNQELQEGLGQVEIHIVDPIDIHWTKGAKALDESNFVAIDMEMSSMTLKKKYAIDSSGNYDQEMSNKIDRMVGKTSATNDTKKKNATGIVSQVNDAGASQSYVYDSAGIAQADKMVKVIKFYLKDDSVFMPDQTDDASITKDKQELVYKYPNGRMIIYSGTESNFEVFEDKPIDYRYGFPVQIFNEDGYNGLNNKGEVEDLIFIQDRINRAYSRLQSLIGKYLSVICVDKMMSDSIQEGDFVRNFVVFIDNMKTNGIPVVVTNNTLAEIGSILEYIRQLKTDAKEIARINDIMISGSTVNSNVKSGTMVEALKESPQASIRSIQRCWREFLIELGNKCVSLVQEFYTLPRVVRINEGKDYAIIPMAEYDEANKRIPKQISVYSKELQSITKEIKDLSIGKFEIEITAGTEVPRSKSETAALMQNLMQQGLLGDISDLDIREQYFRALDLPNYRAFMNVLRDKQKNMTQAPLPNTDKITVGFKDLPVAAQDFWLTSNGFPAQQQLNNEMISADGMPQADEQNDLALMQ